MTPIIAAIIPGIMSLISRFFPEDPLKAQEMQMELVKHLAAIDVAQMEVNKAEATHSSIFVAGWRPAIGWICAIALGTQFLVLPLLEVIGMYIGHPIKLPKLDFEALYGILAGMLGLGGLRSYEKSKGIGDSKIGKKR